MIKIIIFATKMELKMELKIENLKILREKEDHVEFKEAKHNYPFAGGQKSDPRERRRCVLGYIVALANELGGMLVLGMDDNYPHKVVGTDFALNSVGNLEDEIYERLHIRVRTEEIFDDGKRILVIHVPSRPIGKALRFEGVPLMRVGESLREMDDAEYFNIISEQDPDFSDKICHGLSIADLDENAINRMRALIAEKRKRGDFLAMPKRQLLSDLRLLSPDGHLKYAALILLGKSECIANYLPNNNVVVEYRNSRDSVRYDARKEFRLPLFLAIDEIWGYVNQPASNPLLHVKDMPYIIDVPALNEETIREAIINAMIHRSFQISGDIFIRQFPDGIEISNPGGFPYGVNTDNILTVNSSPRSRLMAEVVEKTGLIERSGQGVDIMYANCVKEGKPLPDYSRSDDFQVTLRLHSVIKDDAFYLFVRDILNDYEAEKQMNTFDWLTLHYVWAGNISLVYEDSVNKLLDMGLIVHDEYFKYVLGDAYIEKLVPVKPEGVANRNLSIVYYTTKRNGNASMSDYVKSFEGILTQKQVRTMINKLYDSGILSSSGKARATRYTWI